MNKTLERLQIALQTAQQELDETRRALTAAEAQNAKYRIAADEFDITCRKIEQAHQEWISALDVVKDPILMYDKDFRILRCNLAYQQRAGMPFAQIIGQPYYEIFPKTHEPLIMCNESRLQSVTEVELRVDGRIYCSNSYPVMDGQGGYRHTVLTLEDITERKQSEEGLKLFRALIDKSNDAVELFDPVTLCFFDVNETACRTLGYSRDELLSMSVFDIDPAVGEAQIKEIDEELHAHGSMVFEARHRRKDGSSFPVEISLSQVQLGRKYRVAVVRDITERQRAEQILKDEKAFSEALVQGLPDIFYLLDSNLGLLQWNTKLLELLGLSAKHASSVNVLAYVHEEDRARVAEKIQEASNAGSTSVEARLLLANGLRDYLLTSTRIETRYGMSIIGVGLDITERRQAETRLLESESRLHAIFDGVLDGIMLADVETKQLSSANQAMLDMLGYTQDEFSRLTVSDIHPEQDLQYVLEQFEAQARGEIRFTTDIPIKRKDGSVFYADINTALVRMKRKNYMVGISRDITERKQADEALHRAVRALKTLSDVNAALVHAENEHDLLNKICQILVETGGYQMAWVGTAEQDTARTVRLVAQFGDDTGFVPRAKMTWADSARGQSPTGIAIRTNAIACNQDCQHDPKMKPWHKAVIARGYQSCIAFPLVVHDSLWGALTIYSNRPFAFVDEEMVRLKELVDDLTYGIETLRTRREHEQHSVTLRRSLEQSIETIAATVESRDPYTAGHQRRVGELSVAIAREMGLPEDQIQGLHLAAIVHDLGKIHIPAEILAKPGELSDIEFELIKTHPQAGYDILKNVEFPWPIAEIVRQHHENLDGSGYPQGLKGDQILIESRILTVADIVEAMSSHRPYRSAMGIKSALEEITRGRGVKYDPVVVDTCLKLFAEKKFKFSKR
jgi:PAS domain S-box-containing protein